MAKPPGNGYSNPRAAADLRVSCRNSTILEFRIGNPAENVYIYIKKVNARKVLMEMFRRRGESIHQPAEDLGCAPCRWMSVTVAVSEVGSGLISITAAPDSFAIRGMSQAGKPGGGADHHKDAAGPGLLLGLFLCKPRDRFPEEDDVGLQDLAAIAQGNGPRRPPLPCWVPLPAGDADQGFHVPVVLDDRREPAAWCSPSRSG